MLLPGPDSQADLPVLIGPSPFGSDKPGSFGTGGRKQKAAARSRRDLEGNPSPGALEAVRWGEPVPSPIRPGSGLPATAFGGHEAETSCPARGSQARDPRQPIMRPEP